MFKTFFPSSFIFVLFWPDLSFAELKQLHLPVFSSAADSQKFIYSYKFFKSLTPTDTTIIVLNGGPGATLLEFPSPYQQADGQLNPFPLAGVGNHKFNLIYTDQRGSGLNKTIPDQYSWNAFTIENLAHDILAIVKAENLKNYLIYGASFGTVHASYVAHLIEKQGLPKPKALVLEGTLGRSPLGGGKDYVAGFTAEWSRVQTFLDPRIIKALSQAALPFGFSPQAWGMFIYSRLILGDIPRAGHILQIELAPLLTKDPIGLTELWKKLSPYQVSAAISPLAGGGQAQTTMPFLIGCRELFGSGGAAFFKLEAGELVSGLDINCGHIPFVGYDSAKLSISTPIYYFQGPHDAASPLSSALYHFENQKKSRRTFVLVSAAAHGPLTISLQTLQASEKVWLALAAGKSDQLRAVLNGSNWPIQVEVKNPEKPIP